MRLEESVSSLLQTKLKNRLYPLILPQKCPLPAVAYTPVSVIRLHSLQQDTGFVRQRIQFSCFAKNYGEAVDISVIIRHELQDFSGEASGLYIGGVLVTDESSNYESDTGLYSVVIEFEFQFKEE